MTTETVEQYLQDVDYQHSLAAELPIVISEPPLYEEEPDAFEVIDLEH